MAVASAPITNYQEAHAAFVAWHPQTLKREGANGMTFDYLPVQDYEHFLDETVGAGNWQTQVSTSDTAVAVTLTIFGVSKSRTSTIQESRGKGDNNEAEKAEARAFRRAAGSHGLLRYLWEKEHTSAQRSSTGTGSQKGQSQSRQSATNGRYDSPGKPSAKQTEFLNKLGVPDSVIGKLTAGRDGTASALITALMAAKRENTDYEDDPSGYIVEALQNMGQGKLAALVAEDEDEDEDED